jgi:hypothetical protein
MAFKQKLFSRRKALGAAVALTTTATACTKSATHDTDDVSQSKPLVLRYTDPKWNRDAYARMVGNLDFTKEKIGWYKGKAIGVVPGKKNIDICGFEGFSVARLLPLEDGSYRKVLREVGFYRDLKTGEIMDTMVNPYTGETVKVVPIANDPFNFTVSEYARSAPKYGGLNSEDEQKIPFLLNWEERGGTVILSRDIHLFYPSALKPDKWPRETPGPMTQVTEAFNYSIDRNQLGDPDNTSISFTGTWTRVTPWFPWMLMDQAPGHCVYICDQGACDHWDYIPQDIIEAAKGIDPKYLSAPTKDYGPSLSSLEHYAREQTPAPPRLP